MENGPPCVGGKLSVFLVLPHVTYMLTPVRQMCLFPRWRYEEVKGNFKWLLEVGFEPRCVCGAQSLGSCPLFVCTPIYLVPAAYVIIIVFLLFPSAVSEHRWFRLQCML